MIAIVEGCLDVAHAEIFQANGALKHLLRRLFGAAYIADVCLNFIPRDLRLYLRHAGPDFDPVKINIDFLRLRRTAMKGVSSSLARSTELLRRGIPCQSSNPPSEAARTLPRSRGFRRIHCPTRTTRDRRVRTRTMLNLTRRRYFVTYQGPRSNNVPLARDD
jgi:hypothetical protein